MQKQEHEHREQNFAYRNAYSRHCEFVFLAESDRRVHEHYGKSRKHAADHYKPSRMPSDECSDDDVRHRKQRNDGYGNYRRHTDFAFHDAALYLSFFKSFERFVDVSEFGYRHIVDKLVVAYALYAQFLLSVEKVSQKCFAIFHSRLSRGYFAEMFFKIFFESFFHSFVLFCLAVPFLR